MVTAILPALLGPPPDESSPYLVLALAAVSLLVAAFGAHAGASLLLYSPTKLARRGKQRDANGEGHSDLTTDLQTHSREYDFLAWTATLVGVAGALPPLITAEQQFGWTIYIGPALFLLFFCVALPIALAKSKAERIVLITLPALRIARWLLHFPVLLPLMAVTRWTLRAMRVPDTARTPEEIADEILAAVTDSATENALEEEERHWIENIVELKDLRVSEAMTPRTDIVALEASIDLQEAVQRAIETGFSRYPVYEDKVDHVVGVFYAKDALARLSNGAVRSVEVRELMRKPLFVPESMGVSELLQRFKATKLHMAIVLDEYGGTAGLISIEDILEEIVGDMSDEFDAEEEEAIVVLTENRVVEISGRVRVDEVNEALDCEIPENPEYDTVAGFVFTKLGKIPQAGEMVTVDEIQFEILQSDDRRIHRMRMTLPEPSPARNETGEDRTARSGLEAR